MRPISHFPFYLVVIAAILTSCVKAPFLTITGPRSISFNSAGGTQSITFTCNRDWRVSVADSWIKVSPSSGTTSEESVTISLTCDANTTYDPRKTTLTIKVEELTETVEISQETNLGLFASPTTFELTREAQNIEIEVKQNVQYSVSIDAAARKWISESTANTKGLSSDKLVFAVAENNTYDDREGTIIIKQKDGELSQLVSVKQASTKMLEIDKESYSISFEGGNIAINYKSNADISCDSSVSWVSIVSTKTVTEGVLIVKVARNTNFFDRTATVTLTCGDIQKQVSILQSANDTSKQPDDEVWYTATKQYVPARYDVFGVKYLHEQSSFDSETGFGILKCAHPIECFGSGAFSGASEVISVSIPSKVTTINSMAFSECAKMKSITIPENVTLIYSNAFYVCKNLEAFYGKFASSDHRALVVDGTMVGYAPAGLSHYSIPEGVKALAGGLFNYTYELKTVSFPSTLQQIGSRCFEGSALESVTIPSTIEEIGESTFYHCHALTKVTFDGNNLKRLGDCAFSYSGIKELIYPDGLEYIGSNVLSECYDLEYIYFPESIVSIKGGTCNSFNISRLEGKFVTDDGKCQIFEGVMVCFAAKDIESYSVPEGVISTGICFSENPIIKKIEFPSTIQKFYNFGFSNCPSLTEVYFRAKTPPTLEWYAFDGTCTHCTVYVPAGCEEDYKQAYTYNRFSGGIHGYDFE